MVKKFIDRSNFWLIAVIGSLLVTLVIFLGISFFNAIYFAQVDSRRDFLISQTELAARGLEVELNRFKEESRILLIFLEDPDLDAEDFQDEFSVAARRTFNSFSSMIDTIWVDMQDSVLLLSMTDRNDFIRKQAEEGFPKSIDNSKYLVEGEMGFRILYHLNVSKFSQDYVSNFYLNPGGEKYLFFENRFIPIGS